MADPISLPPAPRFIAEKEVLRRLGISRASLWRWQENAPSFPKRRKIGPRRVAWLEDEIENWMASRHAVS
ncbi:MAG: AlpA family phage regulatory protein [Roseococcus sp.]